MSTEENKKISWRLQEEVFGQGKLEQKRRDFLDELEVVLGEERAHRGRRVRLDLCRRLGTGDRD